jgi:cytochrome c oxidase subunit IV
VNLSAERRLAVAWLVVVVITLIYLVIDGSVDDSHVPRVSTVASMAAIGLALIKVRIVMREFMDVRHAPRILQTVTDALVLTMGVFLLGTYLVGRAIA